MKATLELSLLVFMASAVCGLSQSTSYSQNIVGYATVTVPPGYSLMANPLSTGLTNAANEIMPILDGELILTWAGSRFRQVSYDSGFGGWVGDDGQTPAPPPSLPPGEGFFFYNPLSVATNFTFIGQVVVSPSSTNCFFSGGGGWHLVGSPLPATVDSITNSPVQLPVIDGMVILKWNGSNYMQTGFDTGFGGWVGADGQTPSVPPSYRIAEGFFWFSPIPEWSWCQGLP
jgi:hypothetical protein